MVTIEFDAARFAEGKAAFKVQDVKTGTAFYAKTRAEALGAQGFYLKGFDTMALLWADSRKAIRAAIGIVPESVYSLKYEAGADSGIVCKDGTPIGEVHIDYGEPCLIYKPY